MTSARPTIYIETSIPSYLTARQSDDVRVRGNQDTTVEWWHSRRRDFRLFISEFVVAEVSLGDPDAARRRLATLAGIPRLMATEAVRSLGRALIQKGPIPRQAELDAYHIAVATANGMDYLLTWNCVHIANAVMRTGIEMVCRQYGYEPPIICTPQELMEG